MYSNYCWINYWPSDLAILDKNEDNVEAAVMYYHDLTIYFPTVLLHFLSFLFLAPSHSLINCLNWSKPPLWMLLIPIFLLELEKLKKKDTFSLDLTSNFCHKDFKDVLSQKFLDVDGILIYYITSAWTKRIFSPLCTNEWYYIIYICQVIKEGIDPVVDKLHYNYTWSKIF